MTNIIYIKGYENHLFKEGSGYIVQYLRETKNKVKSRNKIKKVLNSYNIYLSLNTDKEVYFQEENLQKNKEFYSEEKTHLRKPFIDKKNEMVRAKKNTTFFKRIVGYLDGNEEFLKVDSGIFCDIKPFNIKNFILEENYYYPIMFNKTRFHRRGGRISPLQTYDNIQLNSFGSDLLKGFKGFATNSGVNNLKENNTIKNYFTRKDKSQIQFEDAVISEILYNENPMRKIKSSKITHDLTTGEMKLIEVIYENINKISNEPRYSKFNALSIKPYIDQNKKSNNILVKDNFFVASNSEINNIILRNKDYNKDIIEEEKIYSSFGRTYDNSYTNGIESISFYESLD